MDERRMSSPLVNLFGILVEERTGIHSAPPDQELFASKVSARALEAGFESPLDYYYFLRYGDAGGKEFSSLVEALVVQETYFFRELEPMRVAVEAVVVPAIAAKKRARLWCAASSYGDEPFTLAMLLDERGALGDVDIVATDISERALRRARSGLCSSRSLRSTPSHARARWFVTEGSETRVAPTLVAAVSFLRLNLVDGEEIRRLGEFDLIVCRNVLIYFSDAVVRRVVADLTKALAPRGRLLVGASESLLRFGTGLTCEEIRGSFFYRRPD